MGNINNRSFVKRIQSGFLKKYGSYLREEVVNRVHEANATVLPERSVSVASAITVANREIQKTRKHQPDTRVFSILREVDRFISLATKNKQTLSSLSHADLLPVGHPMSRAPHAMTASALRHSRAMWIAADEQISDDYRGLVASALSATPGSLERSHAFTRLSAAPIGAVPVYLRFDDPGLFPTDEYLDALIAGALSKYLKGGNSRLARSIRAKLQRRDRKGRFAWQGGGWRQKIRFGDGSVFDVSGRTVGQSSERHSDGVEVEFRGIPGLKDGIYEVPASKGEGSKAVITGEDGKKFLNRQLSPGSYDEDEVVSIADLGAPREAPSGWTKNVDSYYEGTKNPKAIWWSNPETGYSVFELRDKDGNRQKDSTLGLYRSLDDSLVVSADDWGDIQLGIDADQPEYIKELTKANEDRIRETTPNDITDKTDIGKAFDEALQNEGGLRFNHNGKPVAFFPEEISRDPDTKELLVSGNTLNEETGDVSPKTYQFKDIKPIEAESKSKKQTTLKPKKKPKIKSAAAASRYMDDALIEIEKLISAGDEEGASSLAKEARENVFDAAKRGDLRLTAEAGEAIGAMMDDLLSYVEPSEEPDSRAEGVEELKKPTTPEAAKPSETIPFGYVGKLEPNPVEGLQTKFTTPDYDLLRDPETGRVGRFDANGDYTEFIKDGWKYVGSESGETELKTTYVKSTGLTKDYDPSRSLVDQLREIGSVGDNLRFDYGPDNEEIIFQPSSLKNLVGTQKGRVKGYRVNEQDEKYLDLKDIKPPSRPFDSSKSKAEIKKPEPESLKPEAPSVSEGKFTDITNPADAERMIDEAIANGEGVRFSYKWSGTGKDINRKFIPKKKEVSGKGKLNATGDYVLPDGSVEEGRTFTINQMKPALPDDVDARNRKTDSQLAEEAKNRATAGTPAEATSEKPRRITTEDPVELKKELSEIVEENKKRKEEGRELVGVSFSYKDADRMFYPTEFKMGADGVSELVGGKTDPENYRTYFIDQMKFPNAPEEISEGTSPEEIKTHSPHPSAAIPEAVRQTIAENKQPGRKEESQRRLTKYLDDSFEDGKIDQSTLQKLNDYLEQNQDGKIGDSLLLDKINDAIANNKPKASLDDLFEPNTPAEVMSAGTEDLNGSIVWDGKNYSIEATRFNPETDEYEDVPDVSGKTFDNIEDAEKLFNSIFNPEDVEDTSAPKFNDITDPADAERVIDEAIENGEGIRFAYKWVSGTGKDINRKFIPKKKVQAKNNLNVVGDHILPDGTVEVDKTFTISKMKPVLPDDVDAENRKIDGEVVEATPEPSTSVRRLRRIDGKTAAERIAQIQEAITNDDDIELMYNDKKSEGTPVEILPTTKDADGKDKTTVRIKFIGKDKPFSYIVEKMGTEFPERVDSTEEEINAPLPATDSAGNPIVYLTKTSKEDRIEEINNAIANKQTIAFLYNNQVRYFRPYPQKSFVSGSTGKTLFKGIDDTKGEERNFAVEDMQLLPGAAGAPSVERVELTPDDAFRRMFPVIPDGVYIPNIFDSYKPKGKTDQKSKDYTDDPNVLSNKYSFEELSRALKEALSPGENGEPASGFGNLEFADGPELVSAEALNTAIINSGRDPYMVIAEAYDEVADRTDPNRSTRNVDAVEELNRSMRDTGRTEIPTSKDLQKVIEETSTPPTTVRNLGSIDSWERQEGVSKGSNTGWFYKDPDGNLHYVKKPKTIGHLENEATASLIYKILGVPSSEAYFGELNGERVLISPIVPGSMERDGDIFNRINIKKGEITDPEYVEKIRKYFGIDAWLENYDVIGFLTDGSTNIVTDENGDPIRIDPGSSLLYTATGRYKPDEGKFTEDPTAIDSMRSPKSTGGKIIFGDMTDDEIRESLKPVRDLLPSVIDSVVDTNISDREQAELIKRTLKARRRKLLERFRLPQGVEDPDIVGDPDRIREELSVQAQDLLPGDVSGSGFFTVEKVFSDDKTPKGRISVQGYYPGHESQRMEVLETTPIRTIRGGNIPPKGDKPALHKPLPPRKKPDIAPFNGSVAELIRGAQSWEEVKQILEGIDEMYVFDFETTGIVGKDNGNPVQLGIVKIQKGKVVDRLNLFMNPDRELGDWSSKNLYRPDGVNEDGTPKKALVTDEWLAQQISTREALEQALEFMGESPILIGHNLWFDLRVLAEALERSGMPEYEVPGAIDSLILSRMTLPSWTPENPVGPSGTKYGPRKESHTLEDLLQFFGESTEDTHSADFDAEASWNTLMNIIDYAINNPDLTNTNALDYNENAERMSLSFNESEKDRYKEKTAQYETELDVGRALYLSPPDDPEKEELRDDIEENVNKEPEIIDLPDDISPEEDPTPIIENKEDDGVDRRDLFADMPYQPTEEQEAIILRALEIIGGGPEAINDPLNRKLLVKAFAGTGKTSTLVMLAQLVKKLHPDKRISYIAFNKGIQTEAEGRMPDNVEVRTADSLAYQAVGKSISDKVKKGLIKQKELISHFAIKKSKNPGYTGEKESGKESLSEYDVLKILKNALQKYSISADDEIGPQHFEVSNVPDEWLKKANQMWEDIINPKGKMQIDFSHIKKMWALSRPDLSKAGPSGLKNAADIILFDEAQDINPVLGKVVADQKIFTVYVGDSYQAIYQFIGAEDELEKVQSNNVFALTHSFRFGPQVAGTGNRFLELAGAKERLVGRGPDGEILDPGTMNDPTAIIVRTNTGAVSEILAELAKGRVVGVSKAFKDELKSFIDSALWLQKGGKFEYRPSKISPEIAPYSTWKELTDAADKGDVKLKSLLGILNKYSSQELSNLLDSVVIDFSDSELEDAREKLKDLAEMSIADGASGVVSPGIKYEINGKTVNLTITGSPQQFQTRKDLVKKSGMSFNKETKKWYKEYGSDSEMLSDLEKLRTSSLYEQEGGAREPEVVVITAHRSKGLEYDRVKIGNDFRGPELDPETGETKMPAREEINLSYVAVTRAKKALDIGSLAWVYDYTTGDSVDQNVPSADAPEESSVPTTGEDVDLPDDIEAPEVPSVPEGPGEPPSADKESDSDEPEDGFFSELPEYLTEHLRTVNNGQDEGYVRNGVELFKESFPSDYKDYNPETWREDGWLYPIHEYEFSVAVYDSSDEYGDTEKVAEIEATFKPTGETRVYRFYMTRKMDDWFYRGESSKPAQVPQAPEEPEVPAPREIPEPPEMGEIPEPERTPDSGIVVSNYEKPAKPDKKKINKVLKPGKRELATSIPTYYSPLLAESAPGTWYTNGYILIKDGAQPKGITIGFREQEPATNPSVNNLIKNSINNSDQELVPTYSVENPNGDAKDIVVFVDGDNERLFVNRNYFSPFEFGNYTFKSKTQDMTSQPGAIYVYQGDEIVGAFMPLSPIGGKSARENMEEVETEVDRFVETSEIFEETEEPEAPETPETSETPAKVIEPLTPREGLDWFTDDPGVFVEKFEEEAAVQNGRFSGSGVDFVRVANLDGVEDYRGVNVSEKIQDYDPDNWEAEWDLPLHEYQIDVVVRDIDLFDKSERGVEGESADFTITHTPTGETLTFTLLREKENKVYGTPGEWELDEKSKSYTTKTPAEAEAPEAPEVPETPETPAAPKKTLSKPKTKRSTNQDKEIKPQDADPPVSTASPDLSPDEIIDPEDIAPASQAPAGGPPPGGDDDLLREVVKEMSEDVDNAEFEPGTAGLLDKKSAESLSKAIEAIETYLSGGASKGMTLDKLNKLWESIDANITSLLKKDGDYSDIESSMENRLGLISSARDILAGKIKTAKGPESIKQPETLLSDASGVPIKLGARVRDARGYAGTVIQYTTDTKGKTSIRIIYDLDSSDRLATPGLKTGDKFANEWGPFNVRAISKSAARVVVIQEGETNVPWIDPKNLKRITPETKFIGKKPPRYEEQKKAFAERLEKMKGLRPEFFSNYNEKPDDGDDDDGGGGGGGGSPTGPNDGDGGGEPKAGTTDALRENIERQKREGDWSGEEGDRPDQSPKDEPPKGLWDSVDPELASTIPLREAINSVLADGKLLSATTLIDAADIEDLYVAVEKITDSQTGKDKMSLRFKLTKNALKRAINVAKTDTDAWKNLGYIGFQDRQIDIPNGTIVQKKGAAKVGDRDGDTYEYKNKKFKIIIKSASQRYFKSVDGEVIITFEDLQPTDSTISEALRGAGVISTEPATIDDHRLMVENRLLSILGNYWDSGLPETPESRAEALKNIESTYKITADDFRPVTNSFGDTYVLGPPEFGELMRQRSGLQFLLNTMGFLGSRSNKPKLVFDMLFGPDISPSAPQTTDLDSKRMQAFPGGSILSSNERYALGIQLDGMSTAEDANTGGADYVFTGTMPRQSGTIGGSSSPSFSDTDSVGVLWKGKELSELLRRIDIWANRFDEFGSRRPGSKLEDGLRDGSSEVMFRRKLDLSGVTHMFTGATNRKLMLEEAKRRNITEINGKPVEDFFRVSGDFADENDKAYQDLTTKLILSVESPGINTQSPEQEELPAYKTPDLLSYLLSDEENLWAGQDALRPEPTFVLEDTGEVVDVSDYMVHSRGRNSGRLVIYRDSNSPAYLTKKIEDNKYSLRRVTAGELSNIIVKIKEQKPYMTKDGVSTIPAIDIVSDRFGTTKKYLGLYGFPSEHDLLGENSEKVVSDVLEAIKNLSTPGDYEDFISAFIAAWRSDLPLDLRMDLLNIFNNENNSEAVKRLINVMKVVLVPAYVKKKLPKVEPWAKNFDDPYMNPFYTVNIGELW